MVLIVASRGRGLNNIQHFEARIDNCTSTLTSVQKDNYIMEYEVKEPTEAYNPHPSKEDLIAYFGKRIKIRKMHEDEAGRLMGLSDEDIEKINSSGICKTAKYRCYGNSIVVQCLYHIFRTLFIPNQPENEPVDIYKGTLFEGIE